MRIQILSTLLALSCLTLSGCKLCTEPTGRVCGDGPNDHDPTEQDASDAPTGEPMKTSLDDEIFVKGSAPPHDSLSLGLTDPKKKRADPA